MNFTYYNKLRNYVTIYIIIRKYVIVNHKITEFRKTGEENDFYL